MWVEHDGQLVNLDLVRDITLEDKSLNFLYNNNQGVRFEYGSEKVAQEYYKLVKAALVELNYVVNLETV